MQVNEGSMLVNEGRCLTAAPGISVEYRGHLGASLSCTTCIRIEEKGNGGLGPQENGVLVFCYLKSRCPPEKLAHACRVCLVLSFLGEIFTYEQ